MIQHALYPFAPDITHWAIGHDGGVFHRDIDLVIKPVGHPALDLLLAGLPVVHGHMVGVVNMVISPLVTQRLLKFLRGHCSCGHTVLLLFLF